MRNSHSRRLIAGGLLTALMSAGCHAATRPVAEPAISAPPIFSAVPREATVVGTLHVLLALTTPDSRLPAAPVAYKMLVHPATDPVATEFPVDPDGTFALPLAPGDYVVDVLELQADELGSDPVLLPLATSRVLRLRAPATGCAYGGTVGVTYGRLPAGSQKQQQALVERASRTNNAEYGFVYRPDGGFVIAGAAVTMPTQRPDAAEQCVPDPFRFGVTSP